GHFIIDLLAFRIIMYVLGYAGGLIFYFTHSEAYYPSLLTYLLIYTIANALLYPVFYLFCEYKWQRTPGKYLTRTVVIDAWGNKPDLRTLMLRNLIRIVPFEAFSCLGEDHGSRGWHDRWSETWVVKEQELKEIKRLQEEQSGAE
ncbi:MAG TPA: RDD family protein, partial [Bacteroidia bacterium]|nr:RDD family protein [Bacteroidia bacterium]